MGVKEDGVDGAVFVLSSGEDKEVAAVEVVCRGRRWGGVGCFGGGADYDRYVEQEK